MFQKMYQMRCTKGDVPNESFHMLPTHIPANICVLQCVAVCCSVLQCVAVCCSVFHMFPTHIPANICVRTQARVSVQECARSMWVWGGYD